MIGGTSNSGEIQLLLSLEGLRDAVKLQGSKEGRNLNVLVATPLCCQKWYFVSIASLEASQARRGTKAQAVGLCLFLVSAWMLGF